MTDDRKRKPFVVGRRRRRRPPGRPLIVSSDRPAGGTFYDRQPVAKSGATLADIWPDRPKPEAAE